MIRMIHWLILPAAVLLAQFASLRADEPRVPENIRQLMQDRQFAKAITAIDAVLELKPDEGGNNGNNAEKQPKKIDHDYLAYLKGRALTLDHQYDEAIKAFDAVNTAFPKSAWARRARFAKGVALARKGDFRGAELVYRGEAIFLLSDDRKQEIADIYLEFAEAFFKPDKNDITTDFTRPLELYQNRPRPANPATAITADFNQALEFYTKALEVGPRQDMKPQIELRIVRCHQHIGQHDQAIALLTEFIKRNATGALAIEGRFRLGQSQFTAGDFPSARRTWQDLLAAHKDDKNDILPEAAFRIALTYNLPAPGDDEALSLGVAALQSFVKAYPEHRLASNAHLVIAQSYQNRGRHDDAVKTLQSFLADERYTKREEVATARQQLGQSFQLQRKWDEALTAWKDYLTKHPTDKAWASVQQAIIDTEFLKADDAFNEEKFDDARKLWGEFLVKYPLDGRNRHILFRFGHMKHKEQKWDEAIEAWKPLVSKYPDTDESSHAQLMIAVTLEEKLGKLEEALEQYKKVTWGSFTGEAQRRIARLTATQMEVVTERAFRSDETPKLKVTTRNIETVTVRLYSVDLETYFRKMHLAGGVEGLDIALIDPDKTFEFKVPNFQKFQELESYVEVPLPKAADALDASGVMAVSVSSKTLEATTLVVQSDLDVIIKSSRDEALVFAQNMRTGQPWAKARVLVSNGDKVFGEIETGEDGVVRGSFEELKSSNDLRVFAISGGHIASNNVGLSGINVAKGLAAKGYIYTDRPAYRPGQIVHTRGVIRLVSGDTYEVAKGKKYNVSVFDNRNRMLVEEAVTLGDFGSFHTHFVLPTAAALGDYRVLVQDADGKESYQGTFTVHEYQLEPVRLEVETERGTYYRGEEITGKIRAQFYYGAGLLVGREIRYQLADGRTHTAKTDDKGEVSFKLATREFREAQPLQLIATLSERNVSTGKIVFLATQGFRIEANTVRPVYLAGDTFEVNVKTVDAEGKPISQLLGLSIVEKTTVNGKVGERVVATHEVKTDEKTGAIKKTLKLDEGGKYVLRITGTDRFENAITGETAVQISDDRDEVRLRILADKHTFKVGDDAVVQLHWREAPSLALVTYEGARILKYQLVNLKTGENELKIPMGVDLAPNFELAVAVMTDTRKVEGPAKADDPDKVGAANKGGEPENAKPREPVRFHAASSPFNVERGLNLKLTIVKAGDAKTPPQPGDDVEVKIVATDPQGKPVAAELSLGMIEQALLERYPGTLSAIGDFFRGEQRECSVRTNSTITFAYRPATQPINPRLLAEEERLAVADEERKRLEAIAAAGEIIDRFGVPLAEPAPPADAPALDPQAPESELTELAQQGQWDENANDDFDGQQSINGIPGPQTFNGRRSGRPRGQNQGGQGGGQGQAANGLGLAQTVADRGFGYGAFSPKGLDPKPRSGEQLAGLVGSYRAPTAAFLKDLKRGESREVQFIDRKGKWGNINIDRVLGANPAPAEVQAFVTTLNNEGALVMPQVMPHETGYWNPLVVTDAKGEATLTFTLPERSTAWKLVAKGITGATLAGEAEDSLTVKKDVFGELKLPASFTDGDTAQIQASVHKATGAKEDIAVSLKTTIGGKAVEEERILKGVGEGVHELAFDTAIVLPAEAASDPNAAAIFELTITAGDKTDTIRRWIPVRPYGLPVYSISGGTATADAIAFVDAPVGMPLTAPRLEVVLGPTVERTLIDAVLGPATWCQNDASAFASGSDRAVSDLMASLALLKLVGDAREADRPQAEALDARVRATLSLLISSQSDDGGWSWTAAGANSNAFNTARVLWALSLARQAGYRVPADNFDRAIAYVQTCLGNAGVTDYESKAILLHGLTVAGREDFSLANQLYRNRNALSNAGLLHLVLTFAAMDRKQTADELLAIVAKRPLNEELPERKAAGNSLPWAHAEAELRALYALSLELVSPTNAELAKQVDWLMAHRTGNRWSPDKATGPSMMVLSRWFARTQFKGERYKLTLWANNLKVKDIDITPESMTQTIEVPAALLKKEGRQTIRFEITGRGRYTYQCVLGGFVAADKLAATTKDWAISRFVEPAPRELDGLEIPRGFDVLTGEYSTFRNDLSQLPVGQKATVQLNLARYNVPGGTAESDLEYLVVTEPLPAGATVVESSVQGGFERFEVSDRAITFYIGTRQHIAQIRYDIHGYLPGKYRTAPTLVRDAYHPDQIAISAIKPLDVLPLGEASKDAYRLTPRELFELGKRQFDKHQYDDALPHLTELAAKWNLRPEFHKELARMLLDIHLEKGPPHLVVKYFETVIEKYPDLEVPFAKLLKIGDAYHEMGEYERSYLVFRSTVETSFMKESQVAGFLDGRGHFVRSIDEMSALLRQYPPEAYVAAATYALAQQVYAKAPQAAADEKLREKKITRVDLIQQALARLDGFLTAYPDDPAADQAAFSLASALLDLDIYDKTIDACNRYATRYPESDYLDSFWYIIAFCHYARGEHEEALTMSQKVADAERRDRNSGRMIESPNKWRAVYIMGQIHHSLGAAAKAIEQYARVKDRFEDARAAIDYFARKDIKLAEVTTFEPSKPVGVELKYRNVPACDVKAYRIDLMKFSLLKRNLEGIRNINLSGIRPYHEARVELGDGKDYRDCTKNLELPLKEQGAYLIVCRGEDLHTSGLVLVSPLKVEVQEDPASGQVRTTVRDVAKDKYIDEVHVKVIGSDNADFVAGQTDLRGIFVADAIQGTSTVIAQAQPGEYAFFRGTSYLGAPPAAANAPAHQPAAPGAGGKVSTKDQLLEQLRLDNSEVQQEQNKNLQQIYRNDIKGGNRASDVFKQ